MKEIGLCIAEVVFIAGAVALCYCQRCKDIIREFVFDVLVVLIVFATIINLAGMLSH